MIAISIVLIIIRCRGWFWSNSRSWCWSWFYFFVLLPTTTYSDKDRSQEQQLQFFSHCLLLCPFFLFPPIVIFATHSFYHRYFYKVNETWHNSTKIIEILKTPEFPFQNLTFRQIMSFLIKQMTAIAKHTIFLIDQFMAWKIELF